MTPVVKHVLIIVAVVGVVMLTNLGGPRLWDRDEPRNAGCAREMLERADWIVPTFNGELRTHKPVLLYWCIMACYSVLGVGEFSARLPSAMFAIGTALTTYFLGRRLFHPQAALWAAIALGTSLMFVVAGRAATPDSVLIFFATLALAIYVFGTFQPRSDEETDFAPRLKTAGHYFPQHWPWVAAMYAVMGLAVLAKGPVGLVLPTAVIGMFLLIMRLPAGDKAKTTAVVVKNAAPKFTADSNPIAKSVTKVSAKPTVEIEPEAQAPTNGKKFADEPSEEVFSRWLRKVAVWLRPFSPLHFLQTCWYMRPITAIVMAAAVALPWYYAVGAKTDGKFIEGFIFQHNFGRATQSFEGHRGFIFFYPLILLIGFFPWSMFATSLIVETVQRVRRRDAASPAYLLAVCWVGVYIGIFTLAQTKLPSYITPCYPALALLAGAFIEHWRRHTATPSAVRWLPISFGSLAIFGIAVVGGLLYIAQKYLPGEAWIAAIGGVPLAAGIICLMLFYRQRTREAAFVFATAAVAFPTLLLALGAQRADAHQTNHLILQAINEHSKNPQLASYRSVEPSLVFYSGRTIHTIPHVSEGSVSGAANKAGKRVHIAHASAQAQAARFFSESGDRLLITTRRAMQDIERGLPAGVSVIAETDLFLKEEKLVLLGRPKSTTQFAERTAPATDKIIQRK